MSHNSSVKEGKLWSMAPLMVSLYRASSKPALRSLVRNLVLRAEGGPVYSQTIRRLFSEFHGVHVGMYTIGPCDVPPGNLDPGTTVGRYSSVYWTVRAINTPDPSKVLGNQQLFLPKALTGDTSIETPTETLRIGHDVWMGHNVIVLPGAKSIGDGAIVGAGSVVHTAIPPYAIATGNPARVVRYRFPEKVIAELIESKWWDKSIDELSVNMDKYRQPLDFNNLPV